MNCWLSHRRRSSEEARDLALSVAEGVKPKDIREVYWIHLGDGRRNHLQFFQIDREPISLFDLLFSHNSVRSFACLEKLLSCLQ